MNILERYHHHHHRRRRRHEHTACTVLGFVTCSRPINSLEVF